MGGGLRCMAIGALLLVAPGASARNFEAEIVAAGNLLAQGPFEGTAEASSLHFNASVPLMGEGRGEIHVVDREVVVLETSGGSNPTRTRQERTVAERARDPIPWSGPLEIHPVEPVRRLVIADNGGLLTSPYAAKGGVMADIWPGDELRPSPPFDPIYDGRSFSPKGPAVVVADLATWQVEGPALVLAHGYEIRVGGTKLATGDELLRGTSPAGANTTIQHWRRTYAVLDATSLRVALPAGTTTAYIRQMAGSFTGDLVLTDAHAAGSVGSDQLNESTAVFQVKGSFRLDLTTGLEGAQTHVAGQASYLALDTISRPIIASAAAAVGASALAGLAVLAWLRAAGWAGSLAAGLHRASPLANETRQRILATIRERPGVTRRHLEDALGVGRATIQFHVGVLLRAKLVACQRQAGREHYHPASAAPSQIANHLAIEARAAILLALADGVPKSFPQLGLPMSARLFRYHASVLARDGLLVADPGGKWATYILSNDAKAYLRGAVSSRAVAGAPPSLEAGLAPT